jgi:hypothetical protein
MPDPCRRNQGKTEKTTDHRIILEKKPTSNESSGTFMPLLLLAQFIQEGA